MQHGVSVNSMQCGSQKYDWGVFSSMIVGSQQYDCGVSVNTMQRGVLAVRSWGLSNQQHSVSAIDLEYWKAKTLSITPRSALSVLESTRGVWRTLTW